VGLSRVEREAISRGNTTSRLNEVITRAFSEAFNEACNEDITRHLTRAISVQMGSHHRFNENIRRDLKRI